MDAVTLEMKTTVGTGREAVSTVLFYKGQMARQKNSLYFFYEERSETGDVLSKTRLKWTGQALEMERTGQSAVRMVFAKETAMPVSYQTPYGRLDLQLETRTLTGGETAEGFFAKIAYSLSQGKDKTPYCLEIHAAPYSL